VKIAPRVHDMVEECFELQDGHMSPSERPGLGLTLRREFARAITVV